MVTYTSTTLTGAQSVRVDRYRPAPSISPIPVGRIDVQPRTMSPVFAPVTGGVRPDAAGSPMFVECEKSPMSWHRGTANTVITNTTVIAGFGFDRLVDDIQLRVGPPPPLRRPSV